MNAPAILRPYERKAEAPKRHGNDWYVEPIWADELLFAAENFPGGIWDPCCGGGNILKAARRAGIVARGSDIVRRCGDGSIRAPLDFLHGEIDAPLAPHIVMNPPYLLAQAFVNRARKLVRGKVAALLPATFLFSKRRHRHFAEHPPARIYFLSSRPSMPPGDLLESGEIEAKGGKTDYVWIVWDPEQKRPPSAHWLCRPRPIGQSPLPGMESEVSRAG